MSTRDKVGCVVLFVIASSVAAFSFFGTLFWGIITTGAQSQITLEQRVENLEKQVQQLEVFKMRYEAWSAEGYAAVLYSSDGKRIVFEKDTSFLEHSYVPSEYTCWPCRIGDYKHISLYDQKGNLLDSAEFYSRLKAGDLVIAWYTKTKSTSGTPYSPGPVGVSAFYWNSNTGLAVGILRIDGTVVK